MNSPWYFLRQPWRTPNRPVLAVVLTWMLAVPALAQSPATPAPSTPLAPAATDSGANDAVAKAPLAPSNMDNRMLLLAMVGEFAAAKNDFGAASDAYFQAARLYGNEQLYQRAIELAVKLGSADRLQQIGRDWSTRHPKSELAQKVWLTILLRLGKVADSVDVLRNVLQVADVDGQVMLLADLPRLYNGVANPATAVQMVERALTGAIAKPATRQVAWASIGLMRLEARNLDGAMEALLAATADSSNPAPAQTSKANSASANLAPNTTALAIKLLDARHEPVTQWFSRQLQVEPNPGLLLAYTQWLKSNNSFRAAFDIAAVTATRFPENPEIGLLTGIELFNGARWNQARITFEKALETSQQPNSKFAWTTPNLQIKLAELQVILGNLAEAKALLAKAGDMPASEWNTLMGRSWLNSQVGILILEGKMGAGWELVQKLPAQPNAEMIRVFYWVSQLQSHRALAPALQVVEQQLAQAADSKHTAGLVLSQSGLLLEMGRRSEAVAALQAAIKSYPNDGALLNMLGYSWANNNESLPQAHQLIQKANELSPGAAHIIDSMGWVEYRMGNLAQAQAWLQLAHQLSVEPEIAAHYGEVLWQLGQREKALAVWKEALDPLKPYPVLQETMQRLKAR